MTAATTTNKPLPLPPPTTPTTQCPPNLGKTEDEEGQAQHGHPRVVRGAVAVCPLQVHPRRRRVVLGAPAVVGVQVLVVVLSQETCGGFWLVVVIAITTFVVRDAVFAHPMYEQ